MIESHSYIIDISSVLLAYAAAAANNSENTLHNRFIFSFTVVKMNVKSTASANCMKFLTRLNPVSEKWKYAGVSEKPAIETKKTMPLII